MQLENLERMFSPAYTKYSDTFLKITAQVSRFETKKKFPVRQQHFCCDRKSLLSNGCSQL